MILLTLEEAKRCAIIKYGNGETMRLIPRDILDRLYRKAMREFFNERNAQKEDS